ncbi:DNA-binding NarL/FixJ family response regulator [Kitasatospora sp. MAA4]|uniref:response regulator transcription factor n=1 Tax=Kitasatospora sp. MAA4 TaxID=3035093 RepID=UPI002475D0A9|nr:response regulator transcription factor [Kitasatospora sp. MAA4]MDH6136764.1 DNA-binding NarL/FixJ family response regulator [Kitasatospora sp. MAA4]
MIDVLIVDDESLVRAGLRMILETAEDIRVVGEAEDGEGAVRAVLLHRPDVVLLDVRMPRTDGLEAARRIRALPEPPQVIVLTTFGLDDYIAEALQAGAAGFLLKDLPPPELLRGVRVVAAGEAMLSPTVTRRLLSGIAPPATPRQQAARRLLADLTGRESEVLSLLGRGLPNAEIARSLGLREATVKAHVTRLMVKLGATNRVQAAITAHTAGLLDL